MNADLRADIEALTDTVRRFNEFAAAGKAAALARSYDASRAALALAATTIATGSPTWSTRVSASDGRCGAAGTLPPRPGIGCGCEIEW